METVGVLAGWTMKELYWRSLKSFEWSTERLTFELAAGADDDKHGILEQNPRGRQKPIGLTDH